MAFFRARQIASYSHFNRGRELQPDASIYSYGGDIAAGIVFPLLGTGRPADRQIHTRFNVLYVAQAHPVSKAPPQLGQMITLGNIPNPVPMGPGMSDPNTTAG